MLMWSVLTTAEAFLRAGRGLEADPGPAPTLGRPPGRDGDGVAGVFEDPGALLEEGERLVQRQCGRRAVVARPSQMAG